MDLGLIGSRGLGFRASSLRFNVDKLIVLISAGIGFRDSVLRTGNSSACGFCSKGGQKIPHYALTHVNTGLGGFRV